MTVHRPPFTVHRPPRLPRGLWKAPLPLGPVEQPRGSQFDPFHTPTRSLVSYSITTYWVEARTTGDAGIDIYRGRFLRPFPASPGFIDRIRSVTATSERVLGQTVACIYCFNTSISLSAAISEGASETDGSMDHHDDKPRSERQADTSADKLRQTHAGPIDIAADSCVSHRVDVGGKGATAAAAATAAQSMNEPRETHQNRNAAMAATAPYYQGTHQYAAAGQWQHAYSPPGYTMPMNAMNPMNPYMPMMYMPLPHIAPRLAPPFIEKAKSGSRGSSRSPKGAEDGRRRSDDTSGTSSREREKKKEEEGSMKTKTKTKTTEQKVCAFFVQHGSCAFGSKCKFSHPIELAPVVEYNTVGLPRRYGQPACRYYVHTGRCSYGYTCKYDHPER